MGKFKSIQEIKDYFKKANVQKWPEPENARAWKKLELAFHAGMSFFLEYARLHFLEMHYQTILKDIREISESLQGDQWMISKELINSIYLVAKTSLEEGQFAPAYDLFYLLSLIAPHNFDVWMGLGIACQQTQQSPEALQAFEHAKQLEYR